MTDAKKDFFKNISLIIVGLLPILLFGDSQNWVIKIVQIAGILCSGLNLILIFVNLQFFIDDLFPTKTFNDKAKTKIDKAIIFVVNLLFFTGAVAMIFETKKIDNTINGLTFFGICSGIGILASLLAIVFIGRISKSINNDSTRRYTILLGLPLGFVMLFPATLNFVNRQFADSTIYEMKVTVIRKSTDSKGRAKYIFCGFNDNEERFEVANKVYENAQQGSLMKFHLQKGFFGFEIVREFEPQN
ncbi:MAG: hypothetical protein JSR12_00405 [Bacteroidetes bacterium]|nr:hypothetical protein [Bacteroidota bacterium]